MINPGLLMCFFAGLANGECGIFSYNKLQITKLFSRFDSNQALK